MTRFAAGSIAAFTLALAAAAYAAHKWVTSHPDADRVEKAAAAIAASSGVSWDDASPNVRDVLRGHARAALGRRG